MYLYLAFVFRDTADCGAFRALESLIRIFSENGGEFIGLIPSFPDIRTEYSEACVCYQCDRHKGGKQCEIPLPYHA